MLGHYPMAGWLGEEHGPRLRREVGDQTRLRKTPMLVFRPDEALRSAERIERLLEAASRDASGSASGGTGGGSASGGTGGGSASGIASGGTGGGSASGSASGIASGGTGGGSDSEPPA